MPNFRLILCIGVVLFGLSSCCPQATCDCFDEADAAIGFRFNTDSTKADAFKREELISTFFIRMDKGGVPIDTMDRIDSFQVKDNHNHQSLGFTIWNMTSQTNYENPYTYSIRNEALQLNLVITNITAKGHMSGNSCCSCYTNEYVKWEVTGTAYQHNKDGRSAATYIVNKP